MHSSYTSTILLLDCKWHAKASSRTHFGQIKYGAKYIESRANDNQWIKWQERVKRQIFNSDPAKRCNRLNKDSKEEHISTEHCMVYASRHAFQNHFFQEEKREKRIFLWFFRLSPLWQSNNSPTSHTNIFPFLQWQHQCQWSGSMSMHIIDCMPFNIFSSKKRSIFSVYQRARERERTTKNERSEKKLCNIVRSACKKEMKEWSECDFELKRKAKCCKLFRTLKQSIRSDRDRHTYTHWMSKKNKILLILVLLLL